MHQLAILNHQIKSAKEIYLPSVSSAAFYGRSIFTTIAVYNSAIFQWHKHWRRVGENAVRLKIDLAEFSEDALEKSIYDLICANNIRNGRVRLTFFDESAKGLWSLETEKKTSLLVTSNDFETRSDELRLTVSPFPVNSKSPLVNLKSGNYLENILALEVCRKSGFDEAVVLNEKKETVSAIMANLFWIIDKKIYTPLLETGALSGTTRELITENFPVVEKIATLAELKSAAEIFLTSVGFGVAKVKLLEETIFDNFSVSDQVQKFFNDLTANLMRQTRIP